MKLLIFFLLEIFCSVKASIFESSNPIFEGNKGIFSHDILEDVPVVERFHPLLDEDDTKSYSDPNVNTDFLEERLNGNDETIDNFEKFPRLSIMGKRFKKYKGDAFLHDSTSMDGTMDYSYGDYKNMGNPNDFKKVNMNLNKKYLKSKFHPISSLTYKYMPTITTYNLIPEELMATYRGDFRKKSLEDNPHFKIPSAIFPTSLRNPDDGKVKDSNTFLMSLVQEINQEMMENISKSNAAFPSVEKSYVKPPNNQANLQKERWNRNDRTTDKFGEFSKTLVPKTNAEYSSKNFGILDNKKEKTPNNMLLSIIQEISQEMMGKILKQKVDSSSVVKSYIKPSNIKNNFQEEQLNKNDKTNDSFDGFIRVSITKMNVDDDSKDFGYSDDKLETYSERQPINPRKSEKNVAEIFKTKVFSSSEVTLNDSNQKINLLEKRLNKNNETNKNFREFSEVSTIINMNADDLKDFGNPGDLEEQPIEVIKITPNRIITEENLEGVNEVRDMGFSDKEDPNVNDHLLEEQLNRNDETNDNFFKFPKLSIAKNKVDDVKNVRTTEAKEVEPSARIIIRPNEVIRENIMEDSNEPSVASSLLVKPHIELPKLKSEWFEVSSVKSQPPASNIENDSPKADSTFINRKITNQKSYETPLLAEFINTLLFPDISSNPSRSKFLKLHYERLDNPGNEIRKNSEPDTHDKTCCSEVLERKLLTENVWKEIPKTNTPTQDEHKSDFETPHNPQVEKYAQRRQTLFEEPATKILEMSEITKQIDGSGKVSMIPNGLTVVPNQDSRNYYELLPNEEGHNTFSEEKANFMKILGGDPKRQIWLP